MINDRIKQLRAHLDISQSEFGEKIGLKKAAISSIEKGDSQLKEGNIKLICYEYEVNENWLRNGDGDMLNPELDNLDYLVGKYGDNLSPKVQAIIKTFLTMSKEEQKLVDAFIDRLDTFSGGQKDD